MHNQANLKFKKESITKLLSRDRRIQKSFKRYESIYTKRTAEMYLRNGTVVVGKRNVFGNPKTVVSYPADDKFNYRLRPKATNLSGDKFNLANSVKRRTAFSNSLEFSVKGEISQFDKYSYGKNLIYTKPLNSGVQGNHLKIKNKRRLNFYQNNFIMNKNVRSFYKLNKYNREDVVGSADNSLKDVERRLDILMLRLGFAKNLYSCRELIKRGDVLVDGRAANSFKLIVGPLSTIEVVSEFLPFNLLFRHHLRYFPKFKFEANRLSLFPDQRQSLSSFKRFEGSKGQRQSLAPGETLVLERVVPNESLFVKVSKKQSLAPRNTKTKFKSQNFTQLRFQARKRTVKGRLIKRFRRLKRRARLIKPTFTYPMCNISKQLLHLDSSKVILTTLFKKKDIQVPYSIH